METPKTIRDLDLLTYEEKLRHWTKEDPWKPEGEDGSRFRFSKTPPKGLAVSHTGGDLRIRPAIIGRPCFGILTAFYRFRGAMKRVKGGWVASTRCGEHCPFFQDCEKAITWRINSSPEIKRAMNVWLQQHGPTRMARSDKDGRSMASWRTLCRTALSVPFTSSNDESVKRYYDELDERQRAEDQRRKQAERKRARQRGAVDDDYLKDLMRAQCQRAERLVAAVNDARRNGMPKKLAQLPNDSVRELLDVWLGRELLIARRVRPSKMEVARWIMDSGRSNRSANLKALGSRVGKDFQRLDEFASLMWQGEPLMPAFDIKTELT